MITIREATDRNTKCLYLDVGGVGMVVSYTTVVAASYAGRRIRRVNTWGPTTGRHMQETNCHDWPQLEEAEFEEALNEMILRSIADRVGRRLAA